MIPLLCAMVAQAAEEAPETVDEVDDGETIVITAGKRPRAVSDLARPIRFHEGEVIERADDEDLADRWLRTPNVSQPRDHRNGLLSVRGIGAGQGTLSGGEEKPALGQQSAVGLLIDGVPVDGLWGLRAFGMPIDTEKLELLPGPAGTVHGRNALGGVVQLRGRRPADMPELRGHAAGGLLGWNAAAAGGAPLTERVGARGGIRYLERFGSIDNVTTDEDGSDEEETLGLRLAVDGQVGEQLELGLSLRHVDHRGGSDWWIPRQRADQRESVSDHLGEHESEASLAGLRAAWQHDDVQRFVLQVGWYDIDDRIDYDSDRTAEELLVTAGHNAVDGRSADLRWVLERDWMVWQWGAQAAVDSYDYHGDTRADDRPVAALGGLPFHALVGGERIRHASRSEIDQLAVYVDGSIELPQRYGLELGLRIGRDEIDYRWRKRSENVFVPGMGFVPEVEERVEDDRDDYAVLPRAAIWWEPWAGQRLFLGYAEGHRAGGFNGAANTAAGAAVEFDPDRTRQLELGARGRHEDWQFNYELSAFHIWWHDQQVTENASELDFVRRNAELSTVVGLGAQLDWQPHRDWRCEAGAGWLRSRFEDREEGVFTSIVDGSTTTTDYEGNSFARVPELTWHLAAAYHHPRGFYGRAALLGRDDMYLDDANREEVDGTVLLDATLGWRNERWDVRLIGRNLTDETVISDSIDLPGFPGLTEPGTWVKVAPPLSLALAVDWRW